MCVAHMVCGSDRRDMECLNHWQKIKANFTPIPWTNEVNNFNDMSQGTRAHITLIICSPSRHELIPSSPCDMHGFVFFLLLLLLL